MNLRSWAILLFIILVPGFLISEYLPLYFQTILALCGINVILAASLNLVNGFTGQFSMGHAGFMAVGAYTSAAVSTILLPAIGIESAILNPWLQNLLFFVSLIVAGVSAAGVGFLVGVPSLRLRGDYLAIVTLGFGEIIRTFILNVEAVGGARGLIGIPNWANLYWILAIAVLVTASLSRLLQSVPGKQFMAVRDDETATTAMGISTTQVKVRSFVLASFCAGLAGALFAHFYSYLNPATFTFNYSFQIIAMVVLGGMGSLTGSVTAAILLTVLLEALRPVQDYTGYDLRMVIYALVLIILMLTRPQGIFGRTELWNFIPWPFGDRRRAGSR